MKRNTFGSFVTVFVLIIFVFSIKAQTRQNDSRNVLDYYKLLPSNVLDNEGAMAKVTVKDTKNGYLKIEGAFEGYIEVALFRGKEGAAVLLVGTTYCGPVCGTDLEAKEHKKGEWFDLTDKILPKLTEEQIRAKFRKDRKDPKAEMVSFVYELPRYGKVIKINDDESGDLIYKLVWKNNRFVIIK
jgi:hypothetical protein